ncbi:MAG TPA: class I SAM-dependent methyltransferase [Acidobacteriota bacterium]
MNHILQHYDLIRETDRLSSGFGLLEKERSKLIISRYLNEKRLKILDIGGAAGVYSFWLASLGHEVHLIDFTPRHIEQAKKINAESKNKLACISVGDAKDLSNYPHASVDIIVLFGPMYHLVNKDDRLKALRECARVLKKNGKLFAAGINRYASLYDGLSRGLIDDPYFEEILKEDLKSGQHRNPKNHPEYFTTAIFQLPSEMEDEITQCQFEVTGSIAVEGPMWIVHNFEKRWNDQGKRKQLLDYLVLLEQHPASLIMTHHYIVVAERI